MPFVKKFSDETKADAVALVESGIPRKEAAAHAGCSDETLKGWLSDHHIHLARPLSDEDLLAYPVDQWRRFTPHEQLL